MRGAGGGAVDRRALVTPDAAIAERASAQYDRTARQGDQNTPLWDAMLRWAWDLDPGFAR